MNSLQQNVDGYLVIPISMDTSTPLVSSPQPTYMGNRQISYPASSQGNRINTIAALACCWCTTTLVLFSTGIAIGASHENFEKNTAAISCLISSITMFSGACLLYQCCGSDA